MVTVNTIEYQEYTSKPLRHYAAIHDTEFLKQKDIQMGNVNRIVDVNKIAELCCLSVRFLEENVFSDYRMRAIMIQKNRKRLWRSEKALEVIEAIFSEF